jgi:hypothetical protein
MLKPRCRIRCVKFRKNILRERVGIGSRRNNGIINEKRKG